MSGASAVLADNLCIQIEQGVGQTVMLEEEEEGEDEGDVGDREGGMELDMWEGQFSLGGVGEGLGEGTREGLREGLRAGLIEGLRAGLDAGVGV